jgi:hypothetical protein
VSRTTNGAVLSAAGVVVVVVVVAGVVVVGHGGSGLVVVAGGGSVFVSGGDVGSGAAGGVAFGVVGAGGATRAGVAFVFGDGGVGESVLVGGTGGAATVVVPATGGSFGRGALRRTSGVDLAEGVSVSAPIARMDDGGGDIGAAVAAGPSPVTRTAVPAPAAPRSATAVHAATIAVRFRKRRGARGGRDQ